MIHRDDLIGIWIIQSYHLENVQSGERSQPWGDSPGGTLIFHPDGRIFALITPGGRPLPEAQAGHTVAFRTVLAYSGHFRLDPPDRLVTSVDIAWLESWVGTEQVRSCAIDGETLTLTTPPMTMPHPDGNDATVFALMRWTRERSQPS